MKIKRYKILTAIGLLAMLCMAGCNQGQGQSKGGITGEGDKSGEQKEEKAPVVLEAARFEGVIKKRGGKEYLVQVNISNKDIIGITAEELASGLVYAGKAKYDGKSEVISADLVNIGLTGEKIAIAGVRDKKGDAFKVTAFAGQANLKLLLPLAGKRVGVAKYDMLVQMEEPVGEAILSLRIENEHVAALLFTGDDGRFKSLWGYSGTGYIRRGKHLWVEIPLTDSKLDKKVIVKGELEEGELCGVQVSLVHGKTIDPKAAPDNGNLYDEARFPKFKTAVMRIFDKANMNEVRHEARLHLEVHPYQQHLHIEGAGSASVLKHTTVGYEMTAWFEIFEDGVWKETSKKVTRRARSVSKTGRLDGGTGLVTGDTDTNSAGCSYSAATRSYTFDFVGSGADANKLFMQEGDTTAEYYKDIGFKITEWQPVGYKVGNVPKEENVTSGGYKIQFSKVDSGSSSVQLPFFKNGSSVVPLKDCYGSRLEAGAYEKQLSATDASALEVGKIFADGDFFKK